jgi:hypothetical protein
MPEDTVVTTAPIPPKPATPAAKAKPGASEQVEDVRTGPAENTGMSDEAKAQSMAERQIQLQARGIDETHPTAVSQMNPPEEPAKTS